MDAAFWATVVGTAVATVAVVVAYRGVSQQLKQNYAIAGAQAAIAWRQQVLELHDRGLSPEEIRYIMCLERGGDGYEREHGLIDEVVRNVPRRVPPELSSPSPEASRRGVPPPSPSPR